MKKNSLFFLHKIGDTSFLEYNDGTEKKMVFLNDTSVFLWERIDEYQTQDELVRLVISTYDVEHEIAERDVAAFVSFLLDNGCIELE